MTAQISSNNTNKLSPQEHKQTIEQVTLVQIIQINLVLKNGVSEENANRMFK